MSSWDRQAALAQYSAAFAEAEDEEALIETLGTPTKQAIELARTYQPTAAPERSEVEAEPAADEPEEVPEQLCWDLEPEKDETDAAPELQRKLSKGALAAYLIPAVIIGLPVTVAALCIGVPILAAGGALVFGTVKSALAVISVLSLVSDILLTAGAALILCALGLLLFWLGLWISLELGYLWADRVVLALGRKLCVKEVPAK